MVELGYGPGLILQFVLVMMQGTHSLAGHPTHGRVGVPQVSGTNTRGSLSLFEMQVLWDLPSVASSPALDQASSGDPCELLRLPQKSFRAFTRLPTAHQEQTF